MKSLKTAKRKTHQVEIDENLSRYLIFRYGVSSSRYTVQEQLFNDLGLYGGPSFSNHRDYNIIESNTFRVKIHKAKSISVYKSSNMDIKEQASSSMFLKYEVGIREQVLPLDH